LLRARLALVDDYEERAERAVELAAAGKRHEAWVQLDEILRVLVDERSTGVVDDDHVLSELWVREFRRACDEGEDGVDFLADAEAELALWADAMERFGRPTVVEAFASALVSIGRNALIIHSVAALAGDDAHGALLADVIADDEVPDEHDLRVVRALLLRIKDLIVDLCANTEPPHELDPEHYGEPVTYLRAQTLQADIEAEVGAIEQSIATLHGIVTLIERWGSYPSHNGLDGDVESEARLYGSYVRRCLGAGLKDETLAGYYRRWVDLLERSYDLAADEDDEMKAAMWIALMRNAAEHAGAAGRRTALPDLAARIERCTRDLAVRGTVAGQVLLGDLPETLEWLESLAREE
jgi:hypothetical protein